MVSRLVLILYMVGMTVSGTAGTVANKLLDMTSTRGKDFNHPYFQSAMMFVGESLCYLFYFCAQKAERKKSKDDLSKEALFDEGEESEVLIPPNKLVRKFGKKLFAIPALFDLCGSTLFFIGLILTAPSIYQMFRGAISIVVAIYSVIFLGRSLFRHEVLGVVLLTIGIIIIGVASVLYQASSASNPVLGIILLIIGQLFTGGLAVLEEKLFRLMPAHPLEVVGIEGLSGLTCYIILLPILNLIPCDNKDFCEGGFVENSLLAFEQIAENWKVGVLLTAVVITLILFNWTGVSTTKYASALTRAVLDTLRTVFVWIISLIIRWEEFLWLQLIGFIVLVLGSLIYNEIVVLPFWGFKEAVARHQSAQR